ncbi:MAG: choice-of-anchor D domain-containing protein [Archangium sp.]|nr:choice-of-anchor D domain-containing protein [Archangium sp.]
MGLRSLVAVAVLATACGTGRLEHESSMVFGDQEIGRTRDLGLQLTNRGTAPLALTFEVSGDFSVEEASRPVGAGETSTLVVHFTPTELGLRTGTLTIRSPSATSEIALAGNGTRPALSLPSRVTLGPVTLVTGEPAQPVSSTFALRNTGTRGTSLRLEPPRVDGSELCVGAFVDSACVPWVPPATLDTRTVLDVPLSLLATAPGDRHWWVVFPSNGGEVVLEVVAQVESFEPCVFSAPLEVVVFTSQVAPFLQITHVGPGTCLVRELTISSAPAGFLTFGEAQPLPLKLASGGAITRWVALGELAPTPLVGVIRVVAAGTAPFEVPIRRAAGAQCLTISPGSLDFGVVPSGCSSSIRNFQIYNGCSTPVTLDRVELAAAAGEPAGGPNCPGPAPCPEFSLVTGFPSQTVLGPGSTVPATFSVRYSPINTGSDTGAVVVVVTGDGGDSVVGLQGRGDPLGISTATYRQGTQASVDILVMVDASPSFVPLRANVRTNLLPLLNQVTGPCYDVRWGVAAADGAQDAGVTLIANDAGQRWTSSRDPLFIERALSSFDALPVGSEVEACVRPASDLMQDAGVRDGGLFMGVCVTDALEQSVGSAAALQTLQGQGSGSLSWNTITGLAASTCAVEATDDGVHASLASAANGVHADLCNPTWGVSLERFGTVGWCPHDAFFLTSRPNGPLEIRIEGRLVPDTDWTLDVVNNAVVFFPGRAPAPGETLTISFREACPP